MRSGINKPVAVLDWLQKVNPTEEFILIIDADMVMRKPMLPLDLGAGPGDKPVPATILLALCVCFQSAGCCLIKGFDFCLAPKISARSASSMASLL